MQFLIDTATDSAAELYKIGRFLVDQFSTAPATEAQDITVKLNLDAADWAGDTVRLPKLAPPPPPTAIADVVSDNDVEVEIDDAGNVQSVAARVELPAAPPPPPPVPFVDAIKIPPPLPAPPGPAVPPELDARGMPWDSRIHASNRSKTIKGEWKRKRGVDENLVTACEAQNKPGNAAPGAATTIPSATAVASSVGMTPLPASIPPAAFTAPAVPPPPPPTVGVAAPAAAVPLVINFRGLMQKIQSATAAGKLSAEQVNAVLAGVGLKAEEMAQLINNAPLIASVNAAIDKCIS